jgi:SAM-dependent methyltransferase
MTAEVNNIKRTLHKVMYFCSVMGVYLSFAQGKRCPFCDAQDISEVANKLFFLKLFKCNQCKIMFRYPKDKNCTGAAEDYRLSGEPMISYLPEAEELAQLKLKKFKETNYDISSKVELIKKYLTRGNMLDYGASWGYNLWQFLEEGFYGLGYEISLKRATFGEKSLGLKIIHDPAVLETLVSHFDIVFANHVLEHFQDIRKELNRIYRVLKDGGFLIIFVPDCANIEKEKWKNIYAFGERHPLAFSEEFFKRNLPSFGFRILEIKEIKLKEYEIMVIAKKEQH